MKKSLSEVTFYSSLFLIIAFAGCGEAPKKIEIYGISVDETKFDTIKTLYENMDCQESRVLAGYQDCTVEKLKNIKNGSMLNLLVNADGEIGRLTIIINKNEDFQSVYSGISQKFGSEIKDDSSSLKKSWIGTNGLLTLEQSTAGDTFINVDGKKFQADWKNYKNVKKKSEDL
jgi:hypothetical protein